MKSELSAILGEENIVLQKDGIYTAPASPVSLEQDQERLLREKVAAIEYEDYFETIARNHSIPVMDNEIDLFLAQMPLNAIILDIGGCWGWHWRRISVSRPDVTVIVIDFIRANLKHAQNVLGPLVGKQVLLLHADATALPFLKNSQIVDGIWTVQTFQHIPDFETAIKEAYRVLKPAGVFKNYSLHKTPFNKLIYRLLGKTFYEHGMVGASFYLERANDQQIKIIEGIFNRTVISKYTENLFHPDLRITFSGKKKSCIGKLDIFLSKYPIVGRFIARQKSFEISKQVVE